MSANKILRVTYTVSEEFCIPSNIDLENKEQVSDWCVRYRDLIIHLTNGKTIVIDNNRCVNNYDYKWPDDDTEEFLDANDCCLDDDDMEKFNPVDLSVNPATLLTCELCGKKEDKNENDYYDSFNNHKALNDKPVCIACYVKHPLSCIQHQPKTTIVNNYVKKLENVDANETNNIVKKFEQDGKKYLVSKIDGTVFDYDKYVKEGEQVVIGTFDFEIQKVTLTPDNTDTEEEKLCPCCNDEYKKDEEGSHGILDKEISNEILCFDCYAYKKKEFEQEQEDKKTIDKIKMYQRKMKEICKAFGIPEEIINMGATCDEYQLLELFNNVGKKI
jgi:hypothetical protein